MRIRLAAALSLAFLVASGVQAAAPVVPASFSYQGVLLDNVGQPQSGPVDLTIRLWDQGFAGTLLYKQEFNNTPLVDGVFSVKLGPSGVGIDVPTSPLTLNLVDAVTTDLGGSGAVWIEVSVDGNTPLTRTQFRAVPFALKAESAAQADSASNLQTPAGVDSTVLDAIWQSFNFDGGPANTDPSEGTGDTDLDGILNFVDPDNDNDSITDSDEVAQGSDINLVTPRIDSLSGNGNALFITPLSVGGNSFDPGMTAAISGTSVTPQNVTATSFDFLAPPLPAGAYVLVATHPNGETGSVNMTYDPTVFGEPNDPIEAVALGADGLLIHSDAEYSRDTTDDGQVAFSFPGQTVADTEDKTTAVHWDSSGRLAALRKNVVNGFVEVVIDTNLDGDLEASEAIPFFGVGAGRMTGSSIIHDPSDQVAFAYLRATLTQTRVQMGHDRDGNGDFLGLGETVTAEFAPGGSIAGTVALGELAADSADRLAYVYEASLSGEIRVVWDRSGDGDFLDTVGGNPEIFSAATSAPTCLGTDFDDSDALVIVYGDGSGLHLLHDTSGDGDFGDPGESITLAPTTQVSTPTGCDIDASGAGLTIAVTDGLNLSLLVDRNGDADFADTNEDVQVLSGVGVAAPIAVERLGNGTAVVIGAEFVVLDPN